MKLNQKEGENEKNDTLEAKEKMKKIMRNEERDEKQLKEKLKQGKTN